MPVKDINNVVKVGDLSHSELETVLSLFTRNDLRILARKYKIPQEKLKKDLIVNLGVYYRNKIDHHLITIAMV